MALTDDSIKLASTKTPATGAAANHCKALAELLFGLKWLAIDFRANFSEALAGIAKNNVSPCVHMYMVDGPLYTCG